jgi:hypothetical protein
MGSGQRVAMSVEVTSRCVSCSVGARKAPQAAHVGSVEGNVGIGCVSVIGLDRPVVTDVREEAMRPRESLIAPPPGRGDFEASIRYA